MAKFGFGVVGTGMIAGVIADAIARSGDARLAAASSRRIENARTFVAGRGGEAVEGVEALLARDDVEAVYVATPTSAKEAITLAAVAAGKHVLVDKPFADRASVERMTRAADGRGVAFMDATHFVHHPRNAAVRAAVAEAVGSPRTLRTAFYFPFSDRDNIRFHPSQEPMTALGDMAWYSMRAVVEYLRPEGAVRKAAAAVERDAETGGIVRATGLIDFEDGRASTFDVGYTAGTIVMDLQLLGTSGVIGMDDFVLDWRDSFAFKDPEIPAGYTRRSGMSNTRRETTFVATPADSPQEVAMIDDFVALARSGDPARRAASAEATRKTQEYLDALWAAANA